MQMNQTTFYALRAIYTIEQSDEKFVTSTFIAKKENLSQGVLLRVLRVLQQAGFLTVHQGRGQICGGFSLNKSTKEITMLDVVDAMEGLDICKTVDEKVMEQNNELYVNCLEINVLLREELSRHTIHELFSFYPIYRQRKA